MHTSSPAKFVSRPHGFSAGGGVTVPPPPEPPAPGSGFGSTGSVPSASSLELQAALPRRKTAARTAREGFMGGGPFDAIAVPYGSTKPLNRSAGRRWRS